MYAHPREGYDPYEGDFEGVERCHVGQDERSHTDEYKSIFVRLGKLQRPLEMNKV